MGALASWEMGAGGWWLFASLGAVLAVALLRHRVHQSLAPERMAHDWLDTLPGWRRLRVPTARGRHLAAWLWPQEKPAPLVVAVHGWGGNAETLLPLAEPLHAAGYGVLLFDVRCHGLSDADDFTSLPRFAEDLEAVLDAVKAEPSVNALRIGVFGHSVGAGAALLAASRRPDIAAVVSLAAFAHPEEMMHRWLSAKGVRSGWLEAALLAYVQWVIGFRFDDIAPLNSIARGRCPVLLLHGEDDATVPVSDAWRIKANAGRDNVQVYVLPGSHDEFAEVGTHLAEVLGFLDTALRR